VYVHLSVRPFPRPFWFPSIILRIAQWNLLKFLNIFCLNDKREVKFGFVVFTFVKNTKNVPPVESLKRCLDLDIVEYDKSISISVIFYFCRSRVIILDIANITLQIITN